MSIGIPELIIIGIIICLLALLVLGGVGVVVWIVTHKHQDKA